MFSVPNCCFNIFFRTALLQALLLFSSAVLSGGAAGGHQHEPAAPVEARAPQPGAHDDGHGRLPLLRDAGAVLEDKVSSLQHMHVLFGFDMQVFSLSPSRVDLTSRNTHDLIFRTVEIGVALWFPCVLWNCIRPEQLWCLNPKKILNVLPPLREERKGRHKKGGGQKENSGVGGNFIFGFSSDGVFKSFFFLDGDDCDEALSSSSGAQCWICYDGEDDTDDSEDSSYSSSSRASFSSSSSSSGGGRKNRRHRRRANRSLISPCQCKGDVGVVHHDCLKRWLVEVRCSKVVSWRRCFFIASHLLISIRARTTPTL